MACLQLESGKDVGEEPDWVLRYLYAAHLTRSLQLQVALYFYLPYMIILFRQYF